MQINHNIRAMVTQHSLFQNNNSMTKSLEKLSTGLRINRAQDDAAGLAMSEQMRTQIRGLGKAKQNSQDGQAALQIAEGALAEITNLMQRQKELAVQSANDTLTSTERKYLNDEFQALTKEMDRIAKNTDYNGKNVLLFDRNEDKSFGATKLNPYNREVSYLDAAKTLYDTFGSKLTGGLAAIGGDEVSTTDIRDAQNALNPLLKPLEVAKYNFNLVQAKLDSLDDNKDSEVINNTTPITVNLMQADGTINSTATALYTPNGTTNTWGDAKSAIAATLTGTGTYNAPVTTAQTAVDAAQVVLDTAKAAVADEIKIINDAIAEVNKVVADLNGVGLSEGNIKNVLQKIMDAGDILIETSGTIKFGGDAVYADVKNAFATTTPAGLRVGGSDAKAIQDFNAFLKSTKDALAAYKVAEISDPKYGDDSKPLNAAKNGMQDTLDKLFKSDNEDISNGTTTLQNMAGGSGNYSMLVNAANDIIGRLNALGYTTGNISDANIASLGSIFSEGADPKIRDTVNTVLQFDVSKMSGAGGQALAWSDADKQIAMALQTAVKDLQTHYGNYDDEKSSPVGTAASEILHVGPNYSTGLGGAESNQIKVNYTAIDVKGLGMEAQSIDSQEGAQRAIDRLQDTIKVISGNRAAIGTYINRLDYTVNNIASMEYNIQDAEGRIRDTDFSKVTTEFTRNQIMVQSSVSMLAQANSLPQAVLGLLG